MLNNLSMKSSLEDVLGLMSENGHHCREEGIAAFIASIVGLTAAGIDRSNAINAILKRVPTDFRIQCIPANISHADIKDLNWHSRIAASLPSFKTIREGIKEEDRPEKEDLIDKYLWIAGQFHQAFKTADETGSRYECWLPDTWRIAGSQYILEFSIVDKGKEYKDTVNWHGQNTSQWVFAGCILVQDKRVSIHT